MWNLKKSDTNELIYKTDRDRLREQTHGYKRGRVDGGGIVKEFGIDMYTLLYLKRITNKDLLCSTGNSIQYYITNGKIIWKRIGTCICITETLCCTSEMVTVLLKWGGSWSVVSNFLWPHWLYSPWNSLGQNTGVSSLSLLQEIFPTPGIEPDLLHCRWILCQLSYQGSPQYQL